MLAHDSSDEIAYGGPEWQSGGEDGEHASAAFKGKEIGDKRGSDGGVAGFANSYEDVAHHQFVEGVGDCGEKSEAAPDHDADGANVPAAVAVAEVADKRGGAHVEPEEGGGEQADLCVADFEFARNQVLDGPEDGTVNVIEDVESGKQRQREARIEPSRHSAAEL